jgi:hypothetical protein
MKSIVSPPVRFPLILLACAALIQPMQAGLYQQSFTGLANGTRDLGDGSVITSSGGTSSGAGATVSVQQVAAPQNQAFRMTAAGVNSVRSAYRLPGLDPGQKLVAFDVTFQVRMTRNGSATPGQGWALNFGAIPATGTGNGEGGFTLPGGLVISFDTHNGGNDAPSIEVFANGVGVGNSPKTFPFDTAFRTVRVRWDADGLDLWYDLNANGNVNEAGEVVFSDLALPGFVATAGNAFAFTARTASNFTEDVYLDALDFATTPEVRLETGGPVILEFLADNSRLDDEDADKSDWIEIYNGQNTPVDLTGWHLTDTLLVPAKWTFPAIQLEPYGYLIVFASGKNRTDPAAPLHTNFSLSKNGESLALIAPDTTTIASQYTFPAQTTDVSYGLKGVGLTEGYFAYATPGEANTAEQAPGQPAEAVVWSANGGLISGPVNVTIDPPVAAGSVIRYTTDNTPPSASSAVYAAPIAVNQTQVLRARVFTPDQLPGPISSRSFLMLDSSLTDYHGSGQPFSSNLPILVLESLGAPVDDFFDPGQPRPYQFTYAVGLKPDVTTQRVAITDPPDFQQRAGTHVRGNSSSFLYDQKPYALEMRDEEDRDKNVALFGLPADADWVLNAPYPDKTLLRNFIPYQQMRQLTGEDGRAMRCMLVEVFFQQEPGSPVSEDDYRGVYLLVEKIKVDSNRIDIEKLNELTVNPASITGGYILKHDWPDASRSSFSTGQDVLIAGQGPETWNSAQRNYLEDYFSQFESALAGPAFADPVNGYAAFIDTDSFVDNYWFVEIHKNNDGFRLSTYFTKARNGKLRSAPVWDYDISAGNSDGTPTFYQPTGWAHLEEDGSPALDDFGKPVLYWYPRLLQDPDFAQRLWDRYWEMRRGVYSTSAVTALISAQSSYLTNGNSTVIGNNTAELPPALENAIQRHFRKWPILGTQVWSNPANAVERMYYDTHGNAVTGEVDWLKNWFAQRLAWIDDQNFDAGEVIYRPPVFSKPAGVITPGDSLAISRYTGTPPSGYTYAVGGTLYYTIDNTDPRAPGGLVSGTALAYGAPLVLTQNTVVKARLFTGGKWSPLATADFVVSSVPASAGNLVISELDYNPAAVTPEELGLGFTDPDQFEYMEFTNVGTEPVDLLGVNFTSGLTFAFTSTNLALRFLAPGGRTVIVRDLAAFQHRHGTLPDVPIAGVYTGRLDNGGEALTLVAADGSVIAGFAYDDAEPWPVDADGAGYALVLNQVAAFPAYGEAASWRSSATAGGTPGYANGLVFAGNPSGDADGDGLSDLLEYAVGSNPGDGLGARLPVMGSELFTVNAVASRYQTFSFSRNLEADGVTFDVQCSPDLAVWTDGGGEMIYVSTRNLGDGTATVTYRSSTPIETSPQNQFLRLKVSAR